MRILLSSIAILLLWGCAPASNDTLMPTPFDWQGHRGARGLLPENSIPSFLRALEFPAVRTLELDVVVSADEQIVVSHEPWLSAEICSLPDGSPIAVDSALTYNLYRMSYAEIEQYDCGSRGNVRFPNQRATPTTKPLLRAVVAAADAHATAMERPLPYYNIEIKSEPTWYGSYVPPPADFVRLVRQLIEELELHDRCTVQSFDLAVLRALHQQDSNLTIAYLDELTGPIDQKIEELGFTPAIYSPYFPLVSPNLVQQLHRRGIRIIPWTVNDTADMRNLRAMGVDGIITDYPDRIPVE